MFESTNISQFNLPDGQMAGWRNKNTQEFVYLHMVKWFTPLLLILCPLAGYGQFGVNVKYIFGQSETLDLAHISQDGIQASLEYGFRLKQKRIEFHPGLGYRFTLDKPNLEGTMHSFDLDINTAIYPFDFAGDCDCPTWSKEGTLIKKGFFIEVSPGIAYQTLQRNYILSDNIPVELEPTDISSSNLLLKLGAGVGLDIGITEQFTLTPMFTITMLSDAEWEGLVREAYTQPTKLEMDDFSYLGAGIRLTYKPDPKRRRRF